MVKAWPACVKTILKRTCDVTFEHAAFCPVASHLHTPARAAACAKRGRERAVSRCAKRGVGRCAARADAAIQTHFHPDERKSQFSTLTGTTVYPFPSCWLPPFRRRSMDCGSHEPDRQRRRFGRGDGACLRRWGATGHSRARRSVACPPRARCHAHRALSPAS